MDIGARRTNSHDDIDDEPLEEAKRKEGERELVYANVAEFLTEHLAYQYRRDIDLAGRATTFTWCAQWWRHEEAVSRLTGLWRAWENLRTDPTMRTLFDEKGPFHGCTPRAHAPKGIPLPLDPPPAELFE